MARRIGIVTSGRSDFGRMLPVIRNIGDTDGLAATVFATGMHHADDYGATMDEVEVSDFNGRIVKVPGGESDGTQVGAVLAIGSGTNGFAGAFSDHRPDILVIMGDRFDMLPAVLAAVPMNIPLAHVSGGEVTEGVIDDAIRHAVTKFSHLHFPAMEIYAERLIQMGEEPWRIEVVGEPALDMVETYDVMAKAEFFAGLGLNAELPTSLFTFHPETLNVGDTETAIKTILDAAHSVDCQILFTYPNTDPGSGEIATRIDAFAHNHTNCAVVKSLGQTRFYNALAHCDCMIGNSSAGIIDAASFRLPVLNIGDRQRGRVAPPNVVHVDVDRHAIIDQWNTILGTEFHASCKDIANPYGDGRAAIRIANRLKKVTLDRHLLTKKFIDIPARHQHASEI